MHHVVGAHSKTLIILGHNADKMLLCKFFKYPLPSQIWVTYD